MEYDEEEYFDEMDTYQEDAVEIMVEDDAISAEEAAFMRGYSEAS